MLNIRPIMLTAAFLTAACGSGPSGVPSPGPTPTNSGNANPSPVDSKDPNDPNELNRTWLSNEVVLSTQDSEAEATKRTAAISCSYKEFSFSGYDKGYETIYDPKTSSCQFGYKKHTAGQKAAEFHTPSTIEQTTPEFPAKLTILPLVAIKGQNTSGISVSLPKLSVIDTAACHTAELRLFDRGQVKNFALKRNKHDANFFDINSTDFARDFGSYTSNMTSGYYGSITRRDPVEIVYLCDWYESSKIENKAISGLDTHITSQTGDQATWNIKIISGERVLKSLSQTDAKSVYDVLANHSFDKDQEWHASITAIGKDGNILATNDESEISSDEQRNFWKEHCSSVDPSMSQDNKNIVTTIRVDICDFSKVLSNAGVKAPVTEAPVARQHYVAPVHCKISKIQKYFDDIATYNIARQECGFSAPDLLPEFPRDAKIGVLKSWTPVAEVLSVDFNDIVITGFENERVILKLRDTKRFNTIGRNDCRQAVLSFKTAEGIKKSVVFDSKASESYGNHVTYTRSTKMSANDEIAAAADLTNLRKHLGNTSSTTDLDIYLMCDWWALPGESVSTL